MPLNSTMWKLNMLPRVRAVAIDDDEDHLKHIREAAKCAGIACLPLHHPKDTDDQSLGDLNLADAHIRVVICDLHLNPGTETNDKQAINTVASLLLQLKIPDWTPYVFVLWTRYAEQLTALGAFFSERISAKNLPTLLVALDKTEYGIGQNKEGSAVDSKKLWSDLKERIHASRGLNLLLQWEKEILQSANEVVRDLIQLSRRTDNPGKYKTSIDIDNEIDRVVSLVARSATSYLYAKDNPRAAVNEGLIPLLTDEIQHLIVDDLSQRRWEAALTKRTPKDLHPTDAEISFFGDAFFVSRDTKTTGALRGAVIDDNWHSHNEFLNLFGKKRTELQVVFGLVDPQLLTFRIRYVQIEGLCDSAQQKKGVVPFVLACEVPCSTQIKKANDGENSRPASVEISPPYRQPDDGSEWRLVVNLRYYFTVSRSVAAAKAAVFRIREPLVAKWAFAWANHAIRPGIAEFGPER